MSQPTLPHPVRTAGRVFAWVLAGVLLIALAATVWVGVRGSLAYAHLKTVQDAMATATASGTDPADAATALQPLASDVASAHNLTSDPIWRAAEHLPWVGPQLAAFGTVAASADTLFTGLSPLATAANGLSIDSLRPTGGRIDPGVLDPLAAPAQTAATGAEAAAQGIRNIDRAPLLGTLARSVDDADRLFTRVASAVDALSRTAQVLPDMLGRHRGCRRRAARR